MVRILCIMGSMDIGGAETFIMKLYRNVNRDELQFDFLLNFDKETFYEKEINELGGKIYRGPQKSCGVYKYLKNIRKIIQENKHAVVFKCTENAFSWIDIFAAMLGGAKVKIVRSTNTKLENGILSKLLHYLSKPWLNFICDIKIAPSTEAGLWLFGKQHVKKGNVVILKNAVPVDVFDYDELQRIKMRRELKIENQFVVGHIGRFSNQKNHKFLIEIFSEILKINDKATLLLVGVGKLEDEIKFQAKKLGIYGNIIFFGTSTRIPELLMAMDAFVFPSFYEGMPNTVIEAQATGVPCFVSDMITKEADITNVVAFLSLEDSSDKWAECICESTLQMERESQRIEMINAGYDLKSVANLFQKMVIDRVEV